MDLLKDVADNFTSFLKAFRRPDFSKDLDLWQLLTDQKEGYEVSSTHDILPHVEKLITQLQLLKERVLRTSSEQNGDEKQLKCEDEAMETDNQNIQKDCSDTITPSDTSTKRDADCGQRTSYIVNTSNVQIKASRNEIERRIASFIEKKQREVNQLNNREFCSGFSLLSDGQDAEHSCARTDAVFVPRAGSKSHIKISRVVNPYGPQTKPDPGGLTALIDERSQQSETMGVEERIKNIESHLSLQSSGKSKLDLYNRLKALEDRILYLEGLSPEYFQNVPLPKRQRVMEETQGKNTFENLSLQEIDKKIQELQASLQMRKTASSWQD